MDLKKIIHEWNVDKIIRDANIQNFKETGLWRRGPEPNFEVTERVIEVLLGAVIEQDKRLRELETKVDKHGNILAGTGLI